MDSGPRLVGVMVRSKLVQFFEKKKLEPGQVLYYGSIKASGGCDLGL